MEGSRRFAPIPVVVFAVQASAVACDRINASTHPGLWPTAMAVFVIIAVAGVGSILPHRYDTAEYVAFGSLLGLTNTGFVGYLLLLSGLPYRHAGALTDRGRDFLIITAVLAALSVVILLHGMACRRPLRP
jgi:hypothetical protein